MRRGKHFRRSIDDPEEAVDDAQKWQAKAEHHEAHALRLQRDLDARLHKHAAEVRRLQADLEWAYSTNAALALELSETRFALDQIRGDA